MKFNVYLRAAALIFTITVTAGPLNALVTDAGLSGLSLDVALVLSLVVVGGLVVAALSLPVFGGFSGEGYLSSMSPMIAFVMGFLVYEWLGLEVFNYVREAELSFILFASFAIGFSIVLGTIAYLVGVGARFMSDTPREGPGQPA